MWLVSAHRHSFHSTSYQAIAPVSMCRLAKPLAIIVVAKILTMNQTPSHDHPNLDLLSILPKTNRIIEIGCSSGSLAKAYKQLHPDSFYLGIEIDPDYAKKAGERCDNVIVGDIEYLINSEQSASILHADCWVFGDTLEHLRDPWGVLRFIRCSMHPKTCICACIPNMQHWSIQLGLNAGNIEYQDQGLLDRTHLRWFTRRSIITLFASCGFKLDYMRPRIFESTAAEKGCELIGEFASLAGHDPHQAILDAMPLQYIVRATQQ